ncbi:MAG: NfeD family protein [Alphaproteobacteria bacterium]
MLDPALIWLIIGVALITLELFAPGTFLLWFGLAALITATVSYFFSASLEIQLITMAAASVIAVLIGRMLYKKVGDTSDMSSEPLNERTTRYIGMTTHTETAIVDGRGRIKVEDSSWLCESKTDLPEKTKVKIIGANGTVLIVEPV